MVFPQELGMTKDQKDEKVLEFRKEYKQLTYHDLSNEFSKLTAEIRSKWNTDSFETTTDKTRQAEMMNLVLRRTALFQESKDMRHLLS